MRKTIKVIALPRKRAAMLEQADFIEAIVRDDLARLFREDRATALKIADASAREYSKMVESRNV